MWVFPRQIRGNRYSQAEEGDFTYELRGETVGHPFIPSCKKFSLYRTLYFLVGHKKIIQLFLNKMCP